MNLEFLSAGCKYLMNRAAAGVVSAVLFYCFSREYEPQKYLGGYALI
jgi:hypothetical protein